MLHERVQTAMKISGTQQTAAAAAANEPTAARRILAALAIALSACALLCGYEFLRSVSQSLYIKTYGADRLPAVMALGPLGTLALIYLYGRLLSIAGAYRAIVYTAVFAYAVILLCFQAISAGSRIATGVLYVFREAYIVLLVEQIWSFINSILRAADGRKLNGPVCGIASLGALAGGLFVRHFATLIGSANLLVFAALSLLPTALFAALAYRAGGEPQPAPHEARGRHGHLGLKSLWTSRTLRDLALLIAATQVVSAVLDLQVSRFVEQTIGIPDERTRWFGGFYAALNVGSAFCQFIAAPLLMHLLTPRSIQVAIPLVHLGACAASLAWPALATAAAAFFIFKMLDYSLFRATKELLYIPLSYDARYRAKEMIDAFVYRFAKGGIAAILAGVGRFTALPVAGLPLIAIAVLTAWLPLAAIVTRPAISEGPHAAGRDDSG
jgi:AAA family ATP:ADP antiporter